MKTQEVEILRKQIKKLDDTDFDLQAWKTGAIILLERLFGPGNQKISQMEKIKYDQSSWALREAKGSKNMMDTCKKQGREILDIAIEELEHFGLPEEIEAAQAAPFKLTVVQALENELKISEYRHILKIIHSDKKFDEKKKELIDAFNTCGHDVAENVLSSILLSEETKKYL